MGRRVLRCRGQIKQDEESVAVEKIKYSHGSDTQVFSGTASGATSLALPKGFPDANLRALGGSRRGQIKQDEESAAVEKIKYSHGSDTQIFSGTASGATNLVLLGKDESQ